MDIESEILIREAQTQLGVSENASLQDVVRAYRKLASQYHPDSVRSLGEEAQELARQQMVKINDAYHILKEWLGRKNRRVGAEKSPTKSGDAKKNSVVFRCDGCQRKIRVPEEARGRKAKCPHCTKQLSVPTHNKIRCGDCNKLNLVPNNHCKKAVCWSCFSELPKQLA